ncbi:hypothetical protein PINS_up003718 [Pythium insidiosum]|nr:hypothetical protein PINS_up003718 [Pythium insidiosum]
MNKNELLSKVAKYQVELSRQAEASRQMAVNQSIINYLNTCDGEALEEEVQNPRELIAALKKACKFRHDQYQKVVKEKMRLKAMLQSGVSQQPSGAPRKSPEPEERVHGKARLKSPMDNKRAFHMHEFAQPPHEMKKRRVTISPPPTVMTSHGAAPPVASSPFAAHSEASSGFRANAYTDVAVRPMASRAAPFGRSSYNPSQYGAYNITPSNEPPVQVSDHAVCRRGYDETGKLTTFFLPKDSKRSRDWDAVVPAQACPRYARPARTRATLSWDRNRPLRSPWIARTTNRRSARVCAHELAQQGAVVM